MIYGCRYIIKIEKIAKMQRREVILMQTEINYQQLGQRVREKRKAMNVQQKDMAIAIGTATNHLSDIKGFIRLRANAKIRSDPGTGENTMAINIAQNLSIQILVSL